MASPQLDIQFELPEKPLEKTYNEIVEFLTCPSCNGAQIRPSGLLPSATLNLGDAIADITSHLTSFANGYGMILTVIKMIGCLIEVICAINNPFALIPAVVRLFSECLPEFILLFPLFVVPCIIFSFIKIFLAIVEYILTYIAPTIEDLINNIQDLKDAFINDNKDAQEAVAFKLAGLLQELFSIIGILSVLGAIFTIIQSLISQGVGIPCSDGEGTCDACSDPLCPDIIQSDSVSGNDGRLTILYSSNGISFTLRFLSLSRRGDFLNIRNNHLFPRELDFNNLPVDELPYILNVSGDDFAVTGIDSYGALSLSAIPNEFLADGYLSSFKGITPVLDPNIRFATDTSTFTSSSQYIEIQETRNTATGNNGIWQISEFIDEYNVIITRTDSNNWDGDNTSLDPEPFLLWRLISNAPSVGINLSYTFKTNHDILLKYGLIGTGCHPAIKEARQSSANRFPELEQNTSLSAFGSFPDLNALINDLNTQLATLGQADKDYILDNYDSLNTALSNLDLETSLDNFSNDLINYSKNICSLVVDVQNTPFDVNPKISIIGEKVIINITPVNYSGSPLSLGLPPGVLEINITPSSGQLSSLTEILDSDGNQTGTFQAELTSFDPKKITLTAEVCNKIISIFNGTTLVPKTLEVEFVLPADEAVDPAIIKEVSSEPLGKGE